MRIFRFGHLPVFTLTMAAILFTACGDDDSFSPMAKDRGYDYAYTTAKDLSKTPCNEMRDGREAVIGKNKDHYECEFDYQDSVYIWVGYSDTLTAEGREFHRAESSSSEDDEYSSSSSNNVILSGDSREESSSSRSSSSSSSSNYKSSSSSSNMSSSSESLDWNLPKETYLNPEIEYDTIIDSRDGKVYKTVKIGEQTWMAENLNFDPGLGGSGDAKYEWSWCYDNEPKNCDVAGRLYTWAAAIDSAKLANDADEPQICGMGKGSFGCTFWTAVQGICPDGWHLPSTREWGDLKDAVGGLPGKNLKSQTGWYNDGGGTNVTGFSAIPAGWCRKGVFGNDGIIAYFWGAYGSYDDEAEYMELFSHPDSWEVYYLEKDHGFSVRCIKDEVLPASSSSSSSQSSSSVKSSSSVNSSSSVSSSSRTKQAGAEPLLEAAGEQFNPDIEYGTMTDPRDGKTYKTVKVGSATWMAENLNYAGNEIGVSTCFNDDDRFCELYGHFYSRSAAMNSSSCAYKSSCDLGTGHIQGICPDGWHIPTNKEAQDLVNLASGHALPLMSAKGWKTGITPGTDKYGLSFLGAGSYCSDYGFHSLGEYGRLWVYYASSTQYYIVIRGLENEAEVWDYNDEECYNPVRCVKDE